MARLKRLIETFLKIYPFPLQQLLRGTVFVSSEERSRGDDRVEGSYDVERGEIILWHPQETTEEDLFLILTHEWGHKVYHEWLSERERTCWLKVRSQERIDFGLEKAYPSLRLPEEEYSTVFCVISKKLYLEKSGMKLHAEKLSRRIRKEFPKAASLVEAHIKKSSRKKGKKLFLDRHEITRREVEALKAWIHSALQHESF